MRGKPAQSDHTVPRIGSIPARAGETSPPIDSVAGNGVYPRPCGGNDRGAHSEKPEEGLSPPVRGKRQLFTRQQLGIGSIPARAGETSVPSSSTAKYRVYPRPCGGNRVWSKLYGVYQGLSPPVRGKPNCALPASSNDGSIPARAGETYSIALLLFPLGVYPRPCGGN